MATMVVTRTCLLFRHLRGQVCAGSGSSAKVCHLHARRQGTYQSRQLGSQHEALSWCCCFVPLLYFALAGALIRGLQHAEHDVQTLAQTVVSMSCQHGDLADRRVRHGELIRFGTLAMEARAVPGMNNGSMALTLQTATAGFVFTGDALWVRGSPKREFQEHNVVKHKESVQQQILSLPDETIVCPGHDNKGRSVSTVEEERLFNSRFNRPVSEFDDYMTQTTAAVHQPPRSYRSSLG